MHLHYYFKFCTNIPFLKFLQLVERIRGEMTNLGVSITITNNEDVSTLLAEKLYALMKDDLIDSGTSVISEVW